MRLQNLLIIFVIIALPVIIILSVYIEYQIDTVVLQSAYDSKLLSATYDTMLSFQLNTTNSRYSTIADSLIRDIEASTNVFTSQIATSMGQAGYSKEGILNFIPALVFTLYDGYYIYTPVKNVELDEYGHISKEEYKHEIKPYVYYTKEYVNANKKVIINYSLDNYVVVYYYENGKYISKAGYLEIIDSDLSKKSGIYKDSSDIIYYRGIKIGQPGQTEELTKNVTYKNDDGSIVRKVNEVYTSDSAYKYYKEAYEFTTWFNGIIQNIEPKLTITSTNSALPDAASEFNNEKVKVIEDTITKNLIQAMEVYNKKSSIDFEMPKLTGEDWDKILHNVCIISFIQGFPLGTTKYNNYVIVPSTENKQSVSETNLYYIGNDGLYHRLGCPHLTGSNIVRI